MKRWPTKPLGEVCELVNGAPFKPSDWDGSGLPIVRIQNLNDRTKPFNYTSKKLVEKFRVRTGDTLLAWSGTPGTSFGCFRWDGPEGWLNQHIFNVHLDDEVLPAFFIHQVNSKLEELIGKAHGGVGLQHITKGALSSVKVTVPPLAEQKRLVKLLDEADELRKLRAQADHRTDDLIPALFHEMFGDPITNSLKWQCTPLGTFLEFLTSGSRGWAKYYADTGATFLRIQNIGNNALLLNDLTYVRPPDNAEANRTKVRSGDVLLSITADLGRTAVIPKDFSPTYINQHLALLRLRELDPTFVSATLSSARAKSKWLDLNRSAVKSGLNFDDIRSFPMIVPPLPVQKEFAKRMTEIRELEAVQASSRARLDALFQSTLHRAFAGEL